jgi:uncharacterized membrane protein
MGAGSPVSPSVPEGSPWDDIEGSVVNWGRGCEQNSPDRQGAVWRLFRYSLYLKAALSVAELVSGAALYAFAGEIPKLLARALGRHELLGHPGDAVARFLSQTAQSISTDAHSTAALYLFSHGAVKLFLVIMVLRERLWAYPVFMAALVLLISYQTYQMTLGFSIWLAMLTALDLVVLTLTWREYGVIRASRRW